MIPTIFGGIVMLVGIWCQFGAYQRTLIAMFSLVVFGAASAIDLPAVGGASVAPANFFLLFFVLRLVSMRGGMAALVSEIDPRRPLFIFFLLILWILASAILMPRIFLGIVQVFTLSRNVDVEGTVPLIPTSGNISQSVYALGGFMVACVTAAFARKPGGTEAVIKALMLVTSLNIGFAVLDMLTAATHTGFLLDIIHTASYTFLTEDSLGGLKRISGSFSEASSFATFSLTVLAVNFTLFVLNVRPRFTGPASVILTCFIVLATSSAGYAGLGVFYSVFLAYAFGYGIIAQKRRLVTIATLTVAAGMLLVAIVVLFLPSVAKVAQTVIFESLLNKGATDSALERGYWNMVAWQVFQDTHWLGAGIGSTRGSNYALVLLSNLGLVGFALFALLIGRLTTARLAAGISRDEHAVVWAARIGLLTTLVPSLLVGTVYDLGTLYYCLAGIAAAGMAAGRKPIQVQSREPVPQPVRLTPSRRYA